MARIGLALRHAAMVGKRSLRSGEPFAVSVSSEVVCALCGRIVVPGPSADEHHLVPRSQGGRDKALIHRICHRKIHATLGEKELARQFHTWDALRAHPEIAAFVAWVAAKPAEFNDGSRKPRRRR